MDMRKYLDLFVAEAHEHIQGATQEIARLSAGQDRSASLNALFRPFSRIEKP